MHGEFEDVARAMAGPSRRIRVPGIRRSAVAALVGPGRQVWFMRRADRKGDRWSGHVAFPGGREEPEDADLLATTIRETHEELGLDLSAATLLGQLDDVFARPIPTMMVRPYVFVLHEEPVFTPNEEVASVHRCSLDDLLAGSDRGRFRWERGGVGFTLPCVEFDGVRLWGLTLGFVDDLLHRIDGRGVGLARSR